MTLENEVSDEYIHDLKKKNYSNIVWNTWENFFSMYTAKWGKTFGINNNFISITNKMTLENKGSDKYIDD